MCGKNSHHDGTQKKIVANDVRVESEMESLRAFYLKNPDGNAIQLPKNVQYYGNAMACKICRLGVFGDTASRGALCSASETGERKKSEYNCSIYTVE